MEKIIPDTTRGYSIECQTSSTDFEIDINEGKSIKIHQLSLAKPVLKGTLPKSKVYQND